MNKTFSKVNNTKYRETEMGVIPKEWKVVTLREVLVLIRNGLNYKKFNREKRGYPVTRIETISEGRIDLSRVAYIEEVNPEYIEKYKLINGDILFSHINSLEHIGKTAIYEGHPPLLLHGMNLLLLRPNTSKILPRYLLFILRYYKAKGVFRSIAKRAVNQASINQRQLSNLKIPLPPLDEQRRIVRVLSTVDDAIARTDAIISRVEKLRRALLQHLMTHGIGHKGYKQTEIGKIPKHWKIIKLKNIATEIKSGFASGKRDSNGIIHLRMFNISLDGFLDTSKIVKVPKPKNWQRYILRDRDIIIVNTSGSIEHLGKVALFDNMDTQDVYTYSNHLTRIRVDETIVLPEWVFMVLFYRWQIGYFKSLVRRQAGGQNNLPLKAIENIPIPVPPLDEQKNVASIFSPMSELLIKEKKRKELLMQLKLALMNLLLTGKIRVKDLPIS